MSSSVSTATDSAMNDTVTSATPFAGMLWFIVRIFAPVSVKIDRTGGKLAGLVVQLDVQGRDVVPLHVTERSDRILVLVKCAAAEVNGLDRLGDRTAAPVSSSALASVTLTKTSGSASALMR